MTFDPVSFALGVVSAYVFSGAFVALLFFFAHRAIKEQRDEAVDKMLANVALRCIEHPQNVRSN